MTGARGFLGATDPIHDRRVLRESAPDDFAPADHRAPVGADEFFNAPGEPALQFVLVFQSLPLHERLTIRTVFPGVLGHLVAADMNIFAGKKFKHFGQHVVQKLECLLFGRVIDAVEDSAAVQHGERPAGAAELRICRQRRRRMAGHFDFGNNGDVPRGRIFHDFADVILRVKSAMASVRAVSRAGFRIQLEADAVAPRADLRELGIFFDFDAPALIIRQMPVKRVQFLQRHRVKNGFNFGFVVKMAADIEHQPAPFESRPVFNLNTRHLPIRSRHDIRGKNFRRQQLQQGLDAIKQTRLRPRADDDGIFGDSQFITFRAKVCARVSCRQQNGVSSRHFWK